MLETPAFVIASRKPEDAAALTAQIRSNPWPFSHGVFTAPSIFEAYEAGRKAFSEHRRIVYLHDDVVILDLVEFFGEIAFLDKPGLYGVIGGSNPEVLDRGWWWEKPPCHGNILQGGDGEPYEQLYSRTSEDVEWLDGLCLITVDQSWSWKLRGNPTNLWHGYDLLASKLTKRSGGAVKTIPQSKPLLRHNGFGRLEGADDSLAIVRALSRTVEERRDYPNIFQHLPRLSQEAQGTVLELGCREGVSTGALLEGVEKNGGVVISVDIDDCSQIWRGHPQWFFHRGESTDAKAILDTIKNNGIVPVIDVLFIDSEHNYDLCSKELRTWYPFLSLYATIILHDTEEFPEVFRAVQDFIGSEDWHNFDHKFIKGCNGLTVLKLKGRPRQTGGVSFTAEQCEKIAGDMIESPVDFDSKPMELVESKEGEKKEEGNG